MDAYFGKSMPGNCVNFVAPWPVNTVLLVRAIFEDFNYPHGLFCSFRQITSLRATIFSFVKLEAHLFHAAGEVSIPVEWNEKAYRIQVLTQGRCWCLESISL